jgi:hypothetical protein
LNLPNEPSSCRRKGHIADRSKVRLVLSMASSSIALTSLHRGLLGKLIIFSLSLGIVPITLYFATEKYVWNGMLCTNLPVDHDGLNPFDSQATPPTLL